jgi:hypothetical protein
MADPTTKTELLHEMQSGYTAFEALVASLSAEQLTAPGVNGEWSIKDILAHIAAWQARAAHTLEAVSRNEKPWDEQSVTTEEDMHLFNAKTFAANQALPLDQIWSDFRASYERLLAATEALSEADLFEPLRFAWMDGNPLRRIVEDNTFGHYPEHIVMIEDWLAR